MKSLSCTVLLRSSTSRCCPASHKSSRRLITTLVFVEMHRRDVTRLNSLLANHVRSNDSRSALHLFRLMQNAGIRLDGYTFTPVLAFCPSLLDGGLLGMQVHCLMIKTGSLFGLIPGTSLADMYSKCGHLSESISVFQEMGPKDLVAWNSFLSCLVLHGLPADAVGTFRLMLAGGFGFTEFTLCTLLKACASLNALQLGKQIHGSLVVTSCESVILGTALVDFYSDCGLFHDAVKVFNYLNCSKDVAICNSLLRGCVQNRQFSTAFLILGKMTPNRVALTCVLSACSESSNLLHGKEIHCVVIRHGLNHETILCNALLDMYSKCGKISSVQSVFDQLAERNVITWTTIIDAYGTHGQGTKALRLFKKMEEEKPELSILPNSATYLSVLSACAHSGLIEEGQKCFVSMRERHGLAPGPEHYSCLIDLLCRGGHIEEAWNVFLGMSRSAMKPSSAVCVSMLNACRIANDVVKGEYLAKLLLELGSDNPGIYVSLSNFNATMGRWEGNEELIKITKSRGLRKEAGSSWITAV